MTRHQYQVFLKYAVVVFFIFYPSFNAQSIEGYIYDDESILKGVQISNKTQQKLTYTNANGQFSIPAKPFDTLVITSYFHSKEILIIHKNHFENNVVIALHKTTNTLDEVAITTYIDKVFDSVVVNTDIKIQLINDIKNRPYLYGEQPKSNIDLVAIGKLISSLFKKRVQKPIIQYIETKDLVSLFEKNNLFNQKLLLSELKIDTALQYLFFEYCTTKNMNKRLILEHRYIELLDYLITYAAVFNTIVANHRKQ